MPFVFPGEATHSVTDVSSGSHKWYELRPLTGKHFVTVAGTGSDARLAGLKAARERRNPSFDCIRSLRRNRDHITTCLITELIN